MIKGNILHTQNICGTYLPNRIYSVSANWIARFDEQSIYIRWGMWRIMVLNGFSKIKHNVLLFNRNVMISKNRRNYHKTKLLIHTLNFFPTLMKCYFFQFMSLTIWMSCTIVLFFYLNECTIYDWWTRFHT